MNLAGKVSLITGGAQGLGKAFGESLLKRGAKVCIADVNQAKGELTTRDFTERFGHGRALFVKCDVTSAEEFENAFRQAQSEFGRLDILCNNAGIGNEGKWRLVVDINLVSVMQGTIFGVKYMRKDRGGHGGVIINVASAAGLVPVGFMPAYVASKTGVVAFTRSWAANRQNGKTGIRFCTLCPSFADTDIIKPEATEGVDLSEFHAALDKIGIMRPEDVAEAFMELVEGENNNGAVLSVTKHHGKQYIHPRPKL